MALDTIGRWGRADFGACVRLAACLCALALPVPLTQPAAAQQSAETSGAGAPSAQPMPESGGLFDKIGRWFDRSTAGFRSHIQGANRSFDELNQRAASTRRNIGETAVEVGKNAIDAGAAAADVTKDAVSTVAKLPLTRMIGGRERCDLAPNGAPDCQAAAATLCRRYGFSTGTSMEFTAAEQCKARAFLTGRESESDCTTVTFINRAMCQ